MWGLWGWWDGGREDVKRYLLVLYSYYTVKRTEVGVVWPDD